jgi:hypothetical protein
MEQAVKISGLVFGGSALFALMLTFAARNDVPQTVVAAASASEGEQFDENWRDSVRVVALKSASLMDTEPKSIKTEIVSPSIPPIVMVEEDKPKRRRHVERDICQRHGLRKVIRGRGWRCK